MTDVNRGNDGGAFSLADLADLDVSEVAEIRFENLPAGVYGLEVLEADLDEKDNRDGDNRVIAIFKLGVLECTSCIKKGIPKESLVGKTHTEKRYIVPDEGEAKVLEGIGLIRSFVWDMGCENRGKLGEIVRNTVGHRFTAPITERTNPNDRSNPFAQLKLSKRPPRIESVPPPPPPSAAVPADPAPAAAATPAVA